MTIFVYPLASIRTTGLATEAKQDTIIGHIDGVETKLDTVITHVDGIEGLINTGNLLLTNINDNVDGIEGILTTSTSRVPLFWDFSAGGQNLVANTWKEIIASIGSNVRSISFWNPTGEILEIGLGAAASEVSVEFFGPGDGIKNIPIASGTRVSLRCANNVAADTLVLGFLN